MSRAKTAPSVLAALLLLAALPAAAARVGQGPDGAANPSSDCAAQRRLSVAGGDIRLVFDAGDFALSPAQICAWVERSALAVGGYFSHFPVRAVRVVMTPVDSTKVVTGTTYGSAENGPLITIKLGRSADQASLDRDWVMTHEFVHLAVPSVPERSHWLEEGIATYVEPIARVQAGQLSSEKVWNDMVRDMAQGLPQSGDRGLDRTPTWGRTYWGGALFCLLADVEIRQRTDNRKSLRDALRGVLEAGGNVQRDWTPERIFAAADKAVGLPVLSELYARMATAPGVAELDSLWRQLGVTRDNGVLSYDERAPLARVRAAIAAPEPASSRGGPA